MRVARRFAMLVALGWWLGGLTLYTTTVIRSAHRVIGSHARVGFVTQKVTTELNWIGVGALGLMAWNGATSLRRSGPGMRLALVGAWSVAAVAHIGVFLLHSRLDAMLDFGAGEVREGAQFRDPHETYLILTAIEWVASLGYLLAALVAWKQEDSAR